MAGERLAGSMTADEFNAFISDSGKLLVGDIEWETTRSPGGPFRFRHTIQHSNSERHTIGINVWCNPLVPKLTIAYFVDGIGRIYGFCLGVPHRGMPFHKHHGTQGNEQVTPLPDSIARLADDPAAAWIAFCSESLLTHRGSFHNPARQQWPPLQQI